MTGRERRALEAQWPTPPTRLRALVMPVLRWLDARRERSDRRRYMRDPVRYTEARFVVFWLTGWVRFPVYAPNSGLHWPRYQSRWWAAPWWFVVMGIRGLRFRLGLARRGRAVTLQDMLAHHPPGRAVCRACRGKGIDRSGRDGKPAIRFCPKMQASFMARVGFRVVNTRKGPRWLAGFEPERLVGT